MEPFKVDLRRAVAEIVGRQFGVIGRGQALEAGMTSRAIDRRLAHGEWTRLYKGVYLLPGYVASVEQSLIAAQIWAGSDAAISHRAAGSLLRLDGVPRVIELTLTKRGRHAPDGVIIHNSPIPQFDLQPLNPFQLTNATRTIIDLAAVLEGELLELALDSALRMRRTSIPRLRWRLDLFAAQGRKGTGLVAELLDDRAGRTAAPESVLESRIFKILKAAGLDPVPQYQVQDRGRVLARLDFAFPKQMVGIECESYQHHSDRVAWERDMKRLNEVTMRGWRIIRVGWEDAKDPTRLVAVVNSALDTNFQL